MLSVITFSDRNTGVFDDLVFWSHLPWNVEMWQGCFLNERTRDRSLNNDWSLKRDSKFPCLKLRADNNHVAKMGVFLSVSSETLISTVPEVTLRDTLNTESRGNN